MNGLQANIREVESRALFVHCAAHTLNLVVQDAVGSVSSNRDILSMIGTMIAFVRDSPKRLRCFERLQQAKANALRPYCPTRWVLRESALTSVLKNYSELWEFMSELSIIAKSDAGAKAAGFANEMEKFHSYFVMASLLQIFTAIGTANHAV